MVQPDLDYEFSKQYAHVMISGTAKNPQNVIHVLKEALQKLKECGIPKENFERVKKKLYGDYVSEYNDVSNIARMFLSDYFKGISSFSYLEEYNLVSIEYVQQILDEVFNEDKMVISIVRGK